ncbi:MAG: ATP-binding protein [Rhodospirillales bacterium]|nr:ATP-binding protein [Rhodospirillales bacterium]
MGDQQYLPRVVSRLLERATAASPVVVLMGARQTGKSTLVQSEPFLDDRLYLTLDDLGVRERARMNPDDLVRSAERIILDEVQREPDVLLAVKRAVDEDRPRKNGRFILTGSANLLLMHRVSESLAGRATYVNLWPLTRQERMGHGCAGIWTEFFSAPVSKWPELVASRPTVPASWQDEVRRGGYPTPAMELPSDDACALWFDGYLRTYLERDLQTVAAISNLVDFRRLMRVTCLRLGTVVNQAGLGRDTQVPRATVQRYLNLLEASFQLVRVEAYALSRTKRLVKSPKLYWSDPGLALWLGGAGTASGAHLENLVLSDLLVWRDSQIPAPEVLFWRTATDLEVDFVLETRGGLLPVEVKAATSPGFADIRGLRAFREEYRDQFVGGLLLHGGNQTQWMSDEILAVPWWRVL